MNERKLHVINFVVEYKIKVKLKIFWNLPKIAKTTFIFIVKYTPKYRNTAEILPFAGQRGRRSDDRLEFVDTMHEKLDQPSQSVSI